MKSTFNQMLAVVKDCYKPSLKSALWILKMMIPISLGVVLLQHFGIIEQISEVTSPLFKLVGLPGEAALVYITAALVNIYSAIAVISTFSFDARAITMLAISSLIAHNLIVETAVQRKTGSSAWAMLSVRLGLSVISLVIMNLVLPSSSGVLVQSGIVEKPALILVFALNLLQQILKKLGIIEILSKLLRPLLSVLGLPNRTSFLWIVANTLGLAYGAAVMISEVEKKNIEKEEADLLNYHVAVSHSNLEDLFLFAAIGASVFWMLVLRVGLAALIVWVVRLTLYRNHKFATI
jgi:spore maturation protein SpmB